MPLDGTIGMPSSDLSLAVLPEPCLNADQIFMARRAVLEVHVAEVVADYIVRLVSATRDPAPFLDGQSELAFDYGASPRATLALARTVRARAWLAGRDFVTPDDVQAMAPDVLRHRVGLSYAHKVRGFSVDTLVNQLLERVPAP